MYESPTLNPSQFPTANPSQSPTTVPTEQPSAVTSVATSNGNSLVSDTVFISGMVLLAIAILLIICVIAFKIWELRKPKGYNLSTIQEGKHRPAPSTSMQLPVIVEAGTHRRDSDDSILSENVL